MLRSLMDTTHQDYCKKCGEKYISVFYKWCKPCLINNITASGNKKIDDFIQKMQLKINSPYDRVFEWISYNQFSDIKETGKDGFATAIWKDGPLSYNEETKKYVKSSMNKEVALKYYLHNSQNITEFLNEIKLKMSDNMLEVYGISQNPDTKDYIIVLSIKNFCKKCSNIQQMFENSKQCILCLMNDLTNWTSGNKRIDKFIQEMQLKINRSHDIVFEWIPYSEFNNIEEIGKGGFATVYSAIWKDGPLSYNKETKKYVKSSMNKEVALKCLHNSQNITNEFLNEIKAYSIDKSDDILKVYGISQSPDTKDYIMVLYCAKGGSFNNWIKIGESWLDDMITLKYIIRGLGKIHKNKMVHRDFHIGNILLNLFGVGVYISDMGLCGEVGNLDATNIYGVMPYVAPEILRGKPYTQAADIYSFSMVMYFVATGRQPFDDCAHDQVLVLSICNGIRPEITEKDAPKCYIDLVKKCWDPNPANRPNAIEILQIIESFQKTKDYEIKRQFEESYKYRKANLSSVENNQSTTHPQAIYTSRLLNPYTKDLPKYDNINNDSVEITDFTKL